MVTDNFEVKLKVVQSSMIFPKKLNLITASLIKTTDIRLFALRTVQRTNSLCQFFYFPLLGVVPIGIFKEVKGYKFSIFYK